jgi:hypothetical protein
MLLLLLTLFHPVQNDTLKQDQWTLWIIPTRLFHVYHPALETGLEYKTTGRLAYSIAYGRDLGSADREPYRHQNTKYLRLGTKFYKKDKPASGYIMPEMSIFHIAHEGDDVSADSPLSPSLQKAEADFKDWVLKAGALLGYKAVWGGLRVDLFLGG